MVGLKGYVDSPNSAIAFLILPADASRHDRGSESRQKAVDLMASMCITSLFSGLLVHFSFLRTSLSFSAVTRHQVDKGTGQLRSEGLGQLVAFSTDILK